MLNPVFAYIYLALFTLGLNTFYDLRKKKVEDAHNIFMKGAIVGIVLITQFAYLFYIGFLVLGLLINAFLFKGKVAQGDKSAFQWIFPSLFLFGFVYPFIFFVSFSAMLLIKHFLAKILKKDKTVAGYPFILGCFIITTLLYVFSFI